MMSKEEFLQMLIRNDLPAIGVVCGVMKHYALTGEPMVSLNRDVCCKASAKIADEVLERIDSAVQELEKQTFGA